MEVINIYTILNCDYKKQDFKHNRKGLEGREEIKMLPKDWIKNKLPVLIFPQKNINTPCSDFLTAWQLGDSQVASVLSQGSKGEHAKKTKQVFCCFCGVATKVMEHQFRHNHKPTQIQGERKGPRLPMEEVSKSHGKMNICIVLENTICHKYEHQQITLSLRSPVMS